MSPITNSPIFIENLSYSSGADSFVKSITTPRQDSFTSSKNLSQNSINNIISEQPDKGTAFTNYYMLRCSAPVSRSLESGTLYNEIEKPLNFPSQASQNNTTAMENPAQLNYNTYNAVSGYYIMGNSTLEKPGRRREAIPSGSIKKKLDKAYHLGNNPEPGSLVNMTYY